MFKTSIDKRKSYPLLIFVCDKYFVIYFFWEDYEKLTNFLSSQNVVQW